MYKEFLSLFLQSLFAKILLTEILFFVFLQLCIALEQVCVVSLSDIFYQKFPFPLLYTSWSWPNDWEVIITKWSKWKKPIHRTNFLWGGGLILIGGFSFQLDYHSNFSKMDLPFIYPRLLKEVLLYQGLSRLAPSFSKGWSLKRHN